MISPIGPRASWALAVAVGALLLPAGCGGDDAVRADGTSTTSSAVDASWFSIAAVTAVSEAPCASGATPSRDGAQCYLLAEAVVDATGVERATAVEDQRACEPAPGEIVCIVDGLDSTTTLPTPGAWSVPFTLTDAALESFNGLADACYQLAPPCPTGQAAIVVDNQVVSAPTVQQPEFSPDSFVLDGRFDQATAERIAARLSD